jgi:glycoprotein-N-acetylgalactosamine 3-beta-galactosyltransferase
MTRRLMLSVEIALSLSRIGIFTEDTHDEEGRARFLTLGLTFERGLTREKNKDHWLWHFDQQAREGRECCSKRWIGTHYVAPEDMRQLEDLHAMGCEGAGADPY